MEQDYENHILIWGQAKYMKLVPYDPSSNVLIMYMASLLCAYCAFATTFEALEANFFCREHALQFPGCGRTVDEPDLIPEEFVAEENINYCKDVSASEGVNVDNMTVKTSNLPSPPQDEEPSKVICQGPLTFDPSPWTKEKTSSLWLPTTKRSLCAGTTALVT